MLLLLVRWKKDLHYYPGAEGEPDVVFADLRTATLVARVMPTVASEVSDCGARYASLQCGHQLDLFGSVPTSTARIRLLFITRSR